MIDYAYALGKCYPGKKWSLDGSAYSGLRWMDDSPKPTAKEIEIKYSEWKAQNNYKELRAKAYPSVADQLDLIYHGGLDEWKAMIAGIKGQYPKP